MSESKAILMVTGKNQGLALMLYLVFYEVHVCRNIIPWVVVT